MERYYVKVQGARGPAAHHPTLAEAYTEARRLFEKVGQDRRVYVLQVIGTIDPKEPRAPAKSRKELARILADELSGQTTAQ